MTGKLHEQLDTILLRSDEDSHIQYLGYKGYLERLKKSDASGHIRSTQVFGRFQLPEIGKPFGLITEALDETLDPSRSMRVVSTSIVQKVSQEADGTIVFFTENSTYLLKLQSP
jgi:hypothetical protein